MGNLIAERVKNTTLTKSQQKIAEYFIRNQARIASLSSMDAAKEIGVSDASIIRFARAIGFEGFADLKGQLYDDLVESAYGSMSLSQRLSQNAEKYKDSHTPAQFQSLMEQNIVSVFRDNLPEDFEAVADSLVSSGHRYIVGMRGCRGVAMQMGRLLSFMLPEVHTITDGECASVNSLQDIGPGDTLVMFVFSRFYKMDLSYVQLAKEHGAKVCLITNDITGPLTAYADTVLMLASANMSFYHSAIAAVMTCEYILNLIGERVDYKERMDKRDEITKYQLL